RCGTACPVSTPYPSSGIAVIPPCPARHGSAAPRLHCHGGGNRAPDTYRPPPQADLAGRPVPEVWSTHHAGRVSAPLAWLIRRRVPAPQCPGRNHRVMAQRVSVLLVD